MTRREHERAQALFEEGLALNEETSDKMGTVLLLGLGALTALGQEDHSRARTLCAQGLDIARQLGLRHCVVFHLQILACLVGAQGQPVRAARLWGAVEALGEAIGVGLVPVERYHYGPYITAARDRLEDSAWEVAWAEGRMLSPEEAVEYGLPADEPSLSTALRSAPEETALPAAPGDAARSGPKAEPAYSNVAPPVRLKALARAGRIAWEQGDYEEATVLSEECLALSRELGDTASSAEALYILGMTAMSRMEFEHASAVYEEAVTLRRELGDAVGLGRAIQGLGIVEIGRRDYGRAEELYEESLALAREAGDDFGIMFALGLGGLAALYQGEHGRVRALCAEGLEVSSRVGTTHGIVFHLQISAGAQGQPARLARLWGAARALSETIGITLQPIERRDYGPFIDAARTQLGEAAWEAALEEGQAMTQEEAVEYALSAQEPAPTPLPTAQATVPEVSPAAQPDALTPRQKEIARLVAQGFSNRRISSELSISERTVETHIGKILKKLGLASRTQLAAWVIQRLPPPSDPS